VLEGAFHARHRAAFGYASDGEPTEIVALRLRATGPVEKPALHSEKTRGDALIPHLPRQPIFVGTWRESPVIDRDTLEPGQVLEGPALLVQEDTTILLPPGWLARIDPWYNVLLDRRVTAP
jgi:N-methylhydantoinase A